MKNKCIVIGLLVVVCCQLEASQTEQDLIESMIQNQYTTRYQGQPLATKQVATTPIKTQHQNNKVNKPTAKVIHLTHEKINQTNFTHKFIVKRLDATNVALGATGIRRIQQHARITQKPASGDLVKPKTTDKITTPASK